MILQDLKSLIKDFEDVLIKDDRFKNDYKFKSQVKTIYGLRKVENVFIPFPVGTGGEYGVEKIVEKRIEVPVDRIVNVPVIDCPKCKICEKEKLVNLSVAKADDLAIKLEQDVKQIESIQGAETKLTPQQFEELKTTLDFKKIAELIKGASEKQRDEYRSYKNIKFQKYLSILKDIKDKDFAIKLLDIY
jgi:hypothetical protein